MLVERADSIDQLPVQVVTTIDLNRHHSHTLLEWQVGYPAGPMAKLPAVPMDQAKRVRPIVAFPQYLLPLAHSTQQAVGEMGFEFPTLGSVVEQGFAHPMGRVVVEQAVGEMDFEFPTLRPVVVEQDFFRPWLCRTSSVHARSRAGVVRRGPGQPSRCRPPATWHNRRAACRKTKGR